MGFYGTVNNKREDVEIHEEFVSESTLAKANIGICAGYDNDEEEIDDFEEYLQKKLEEIAEQTGCYIPFIVYKTKTVYKEEWGCPEGGEKTYNLEATRNPVFNKDDNIWRDQVKKVILILKKALKQSTVTLQFIPIEIVYFNNNATSLEVNDQEEQ